MPRQVNKLSATKVRALSTRGFHSDGGGLYLAVSPTGSKAWVFRFKRSGRACDVGLGSLAAVSLADARSAAAECRLILSRGGNPLVTIRERRAAVMAPKVPSFEECAREYITTNSPSWKHPKHRQQWSNTLTAYAYPVLRRVPVNEVTTEHVLKVLQPIWTKKPETAGRVRGRIETVLNWAKARGLRAGDNPAAWRGHLDHILPRRSRVRSIEHHPAMAYGALPAFMDELRRQEGISALALEFTILTAARTTEVIGAKWPEMDLVEAIWTVPPERMKAGREHRVPLSGRALEILKGLATTKHGEFVFSSPRRSGLSQMAMLMMLRRMHGEGLTVHGFRSTFKDWCRERTNFANEISEAALAHASGDKVERAYARSDLFDKRRKLMEAWAQFCAVPNTGSIVPMKRAGA